MTYILVPTIYDQMFRSYIVPFISFAWICWFFSVFFMLKKKITKYLSILGHKTHIYEYCEDRLHRFNLPLQRFLTIYTN
jgi:hypothetical protein